MKLDRNFNHDGRGKYAILPLRRQSKPISPEAMAAAELLKKEGLLDFGTDPGKEFFVIKLQDKFAADAIIAYKNSVRDEQHRQEKLLEETPIPEGQDGQIRKHIANLREYADDLQKLAVRALTQPTKIPD